MFTGLVTPEMKKCKSCKKTFKATSLNRHIALAKKCKEIYGDELLEMKKNAREQSVKAYKAKNVETIRKKDVEYYSKNKETKRQKQAEYDSKNRETKRQKQKNYNNLNRMEICEKQRKDGK